MFYRNTHTRDHTELHNIVSICTDCNGELCSPTLLRIALSEAMKEECVTMICVSFGDDKSAGYTRAACEQKAMKGICKLFGRVRQQSVQLLSQSSCMLPCVFMQPIHMRRQGSVSLMNYGEQT